MKKFEKYARIEDIRNSKLRISFALVNAPIPIMRAAKLESL